MADYVKYDSIGTWEWIISRSGQPYLLEVNPGIQVAHDISSRVSYIDNEHPNLLREQIRLALGEKLGYKQKNVRFNGAALELRIVAEDPLRDFAPWLGTITDFSFPENSWSAVSSHVPTDRPYPIPCDFDPNLALALIWGESIDETKARAVHFIDETTISGKDSGGNPVITNLDYLKRNLVRLLAF